jgi:anti-sigma regulatory factor (Ser/Thr protein kinase)
MVGADSASEIVARAAATGLVVVIDLDGHQPSPDEDPIPALEGEQAPKLVVLASADQSEDGLRALALGADGVVTRGLGRTAALELVKAVVEDDEMGLGTPVEPEPANATRVRRLVGRVLQAWGEERLADVANLLVSELISNAIRHARSELSVVIRLSPERLRVEVHDRTGGAMPAGGGSRAHRVEDALAESGRGLELVEALSHDWGVSGHDDGKAVWFEIARVDLET